LATGKQVKAAILARRAAKGPRKKRTRPAPRQYTVADLERDRDRVAPAERRIDNDSRSNPNTGRAGLERAQLELSVIEPQLRLRGLLESKTCMARAKTVLPWFRPSLCRGPLNRALLLYTIEYSRNPVWGARRASTPLTSWESAHACR
jgi:hypothetical protein